MSNEDIRDLFDEVLEDGQYVTLECPDKQTVSDLCRKIHGVRNKQFLQNDIFIVRNSKDLTIEVGLK